MKQWVSFSDFTPPGNIGHKSEKSGPAQGGKFLGDTSIMLGFQGLYSQCKGESEVNLSSPTASYSKNCWLTLALDGVEEETTPKFITTQ